MYQQHFKLSSYPFGLTPDTQFFYELPTHTEALNVLLIALTNGECFIKITGDVGTGKTMLCRKLLNELPEPFLTAYIPNPHLTPAGLRMAVADELGVKCARNVGQSRLLNSINEYLIEAALAGKKPVLIIDEAQAMSIETLEALRLLTNLETERQKLLQIVLFGQPELDEHLQKKSIRQLRQRITFSYQLKPLTYPHVADYIKHRLRIAGMSNPAIFSWLANRAIHYYSRGIPRLINILAHKAMLSAYGKGRDNIGVMQVHLAAMDTEDAKTRWHLLGCHKSYIVWLLVSIAGYLWPTMVSTL
jgi:MSHA biogenesis protein MshM